MPLALLRFFRHPVAVAVGYSGFLALTIAGVAALSASVTLQTALHSETLVLPQKERVASRVEVYEAALREPVVVKQRPPLRVMREPATNPALLARELDTAEVAENFRPIRPAFVSILSPTAKLATLERSVSANLSRRRASFRVAAIAPWEANFSLRGSRTSRRR